MPQSSKPSLGARLRAGWHGLINGAQAQPATPPLMAQVEHPMRPLVPSRFDSTRLGGSESRAAAILNTITAQGKLPTAPMSSFVPADQSIMDVMYQALAPQNPLTATPLYSPGVPLLPIPGVTPSEGPRQWSFPVGGNISMTPRSDEQYSFDELRAIARVYDGIQICEQVWLDYVGKLDISVELRPELQTEDLDMSQYAKDIQFYTDWFAYPDKERDLKSWLRLAVKEQLEVDALAIYPRLTNAGDLYALEILDGATIKPLYDDRGRRPQPPFPAYEQYLYGGVPAAWLTIDELIYMRETERTDSMYGTPRVEKILMRANQALRKQSKDLLKFTEGTVPAGLITVPSDSPWTQDQLEEFEINLNALMAGNDMQRARLKVLPRGFLYLPTDDPAIQTLFDTFLLNITASAFGLTMAELGFTENVNKSSGDSQENVVYRRTMAPLISRYADLLTFVLHKFFHETRFVVKFKGFEETEDFAVKAETYLSLVTAGIQSPTQAAQALHLPVYDDTNVPPFVMTKTGPFVIADLARPDIREALTQTQLASPTTGDESASPKSPQGQQDASQQEDDEDEPEDASPQKNSPKAPPVKRSDASHDKNTGVMAAFFLDQHTANQLALPGYEPCSQLHITLAYYGDRTDLSSTDLDVLKANLMQYAQEAMPLRGVISGVGRFTPSPSSDGKSPVYASVDIPGVHGWREGLVKASNIAPHSEHGFTPHITLAYVEPEELSPVSDVPALPLEFDTLYLVIGDETTAFKIGESVARADYRRWRGRAIEDVKAGRLQRGFRSTLIPPAIHEHISHELSRCATPEDVRAVFSAVKQQMEGVAA